MARATPHSKSKSFIAFWGAGVFPDDHGSKGIPVFVEMLKAISSQHNLVLYSHLRTQKGSLPGIKVRQPPAWSGRRLGYFFLVLTFLFDHIRHRFAVLHAHSSHPDPLVATILKIIFRIPTIVGFNAGEFVYLDEIGFGDLNTRKGKINRWVVNHCDRVTAVSIFHAATIRGYMHNPNNLRVIYRGVSLNRFVYQEKEINTPLNIIQVSYHHPVKDQLTLLRTFALVLKKAPAHLHIVGPDFWNDTVRKAAEEMQLQPHITIHGSQPHATISVMLKNADIMVHTARYDALAVSAIEAMSCGVVTVGTRVGILADLEDKCCIAVDIGNAEVLAAKIIQIIHAPAEAMMLRRNARQWVEQHDLASTVKEYVALYEELIYGN